MVYLVFLYVIELHLFINISALHNLLCSTFCKDNLLFYTLCLQLSLDTYQAFIAQLPAWRSWRGRVPTTVPLLPDGQILGCWTPKWPSKITCDLGKRTNSRFPNCGLILTIVGKKWHNNLYT